MNTGDVLGIIFGFVVVVITLAVVLAICTRHDGYRAGQIDALSGHVHYTLTTQPDGEVRWVEREGK